MELFEPAASVVASQGVCRPGLSIRCYSASVAAGQLFVCGASANRLGQMSVALVCAHDAVGLRASVARGLLGV